MVIPIPGLVLGPVASGTVSLLLGGEKIGSQFPIEFRWDSELVAKFRFDRRVRIDGVILDAPELGSNGPIVRRFEPLFADPNMTLDVSWVVRSAS